MMRQNYIVCGDNLEVLKQISSESVNLIYVDPPFPIKTASILHTDRNLMSEYQIMMLPRLQEFFRILRSDGSIFFHCDWSYEAEIQNLLDGVFRRENLVAKIIWVRNVAHSLHSYINHTYEVIVVYGKSNKLKYFPQYVPYTDAEIESKYRYVEPETGRRYRLVSLTAPNPTSTEATFEFLGVTRAWRYSKKRLEELYNMGIVVQSKPDSVPMQKQYINEGKLIGDVWSDLLSVNLSAEEKTGYPTQKPLSLLDRIIRISTEPGDLVVDPFCGSGTTLVAAEKLGRRWIGIDLSPSACQIAVERLVRTNPQYIPTDILHLQQKMSIPDLEKLPHYELENWVITSLRQILSRKTEFAVAKGLDSLNNCEIYPVTQGSKFDFELDNRGVLIPIMVKQKKSVGSEDISNFAVQVKYHKSERGIIVGYKFTKSALAEIEKWINSGLIITPIYLKELVSEMK